MKFPAKLLIIVVAAISLPGRCAQIPSFPGAEGFGAYATGGRGGDVYIVTNLNASGPGSFAEGIKTVPAAGRTIVFGVSGFIPINKLRLNAAKVTIAGQTAPGGGVCLSGSSFTVTSEDAVIRFLRIRHGHRGNGGDCFNPDGSKNLIVDHCEMMFSRDENFSMFRSAPENLTFQWSINAWGLQNHSAGGLWRIKQGTAHHTLWAHNHTRNPKLIRPVLFDWINNVTFGWDIGFNLAGADIAGDYGVNIRGSSFIHGGRTTTAIFGGGMAPDGSMPFLLYMDDCILDGDGNGKLNVTATNCGIVSSNLFRRHDQVVSLKTKQGANPGVPVTVDDWRTAYKKVISQAGALRMNAGGMPLRDEVTTLLIADVVSQKRRMITNEAALNLPNAGFGTLGHAPAATDTDRDGMPDFWEQALGWNPKLDDHNELLAATSGLISGDSFFPEKTPAGYTRLEEYLHFLATPHAFLKPGDILRVDLRKFASGWTSSPSFRISRVTGGSVSQEGPGGYQAAFVPTAGLEGRAGFDFTVTDPEGSSWTQTLSVLVR